MNLSTKVEQKYNKSLIACVLMPFLMTKIAYASSDELELLREIVAIELSKPVENIQLLAANNLDNIESENNYLYLLAAIEQGEVPESNDKVSTDDKIVDQKYEFEEENPEKDESEDNSEDESQVDKFEDDESADDESEDDESEDDESEDDESEDDEFEDEDEEDDEFEDEDEDV